jgi:hypothetical protein
LLGETCQLGAHAHQYIIDWVTTWSPLFKVMNGIVAADMPELTTIAAAPCSRLANSTST